MAHLTKPERYDIEDSNIALLGSELEKNVREHGGDKEAAWATAGRSTGVQIWRIEKFHVVDWPKDRFGRFYSGDSYIVLHTYKLKPDSENLSFDLHFWLGEQTSQDEAGTAAYKTVELDDHLNGKPIQYREVQGSESGRFLSYFPKFTVLQGGVSTGFHHVSSPPPENVFRLYHIGAPSQLNAHSVHIREVVPAASSIFQGDVFVMDRGTEVTQFNTKQSSGKEKFAAAELCRTIVDGRKGHCKLSVYDEGGSGARTFLSAFGIDVVPTKTTNQSASDEPSVSLFRLSDASGTLEFSPVSPVARSSLSSNDAFVVDASSHPKTPSVYVWIGNNASLGEKRLCVQYAQRFLYDKRAKGSQVSPAVSVVRLREGGENELFWQILGA
ncbi:fragmin60 [Rickenella mellea]|uniref:Fragmin60 n=1 Tax=Rickenella mellea TaxID=50990 RepID=A0A4Y7Q483_9AGAM|nr:fragmin60 [Rickenella mellea]